LLGTFVEITVPEEHERAVDHAFAAIGHVHRRMSFHEGDSDLARLRDADPGASVEVDAETVAVLRLAVALHRDTGGVFDVAVGRALVRSGFLPRSGIVRLDRYSGTTADLEIVDDRHVRCNRRMLIDLGGIAKGYAVDRGVEALQQYGVGEAMVNAGGDLRAFGERDWEVGLCDAGNVIRHAVRARNCAIASSANLINRKRHRGRTHTPHIGAGGEPLLAKGRVSVIASSCAFADAMTKVAMADIRLATTLLATFGGQLLCEMPQPEFA
jgi:thiamine biosynthesis lipoprotein